MIINFLEYVQDKHQRLVKQCQFDIPEIMKDRLVKRITHYKTIMYHYGNLNSSNYKIKLPNTDPMKTLIHECLSYS